MATEFTVGKVQIGYTEMHENDQAAAIEIAINALRTQEKSEKTLYHKDVAQLVKQDLDSQRGGTWNVIVGQSYGSFVSHETKTISHFLVGNIAFLVWRHG